MDALETLAAGIKHVDGLLDEGVLEPDLGRSDWPAMKARIALVRDGIDQEVAGVLDAALEVAAEDTLREGVHRRVAGLYACASALLEASGDPDGAAVLRTHALKIAPDEAERAELTAGQAEPRVHAGLHHARWLLFHRRRADADRRAKAVLGETRSEPLREGARKILRAPRPLTAAPSLFRVNGCGVALYGERDKWEDGWYVATYCVSLIFVPVFPLTAYRVRRNGQGYQFLARERLGPLARAWQILAGVALAGAIGWGGVSSYLDSPDRKARVALTEARAAETAGDRPTALDRYTALAHTYETHAEAAPAALAVVRLAAEAVPEPCNVDAVDKVEKVVDAFHGLPLRARAGGAATLLTHKLTGWADQVGDATAPQAHAELTLLDLASAVAVEGTDKDGAGQIDARKQRVRRELADRVAATRPLQALALYVSIPTEPGALAAAGTLIDGFGEAPSLWIEAERDVQAFAAAAAKRLDLHDAGARAQDRLQKARDAHAADAALIEKGDEKPIAEALARTPGDQELAVALAEIQRHRGDAKGATATLEALGKPGRMTAAAQQLLAGCAADAGDLERADRILGELLAERLPAFLDAQREFAGAADLFEKAAIADAKAGNVEPALQAKLEAAGKDEVQGVFNEWLSQQLEHDPRLKALREAYLRQGSVVPVALAQGFVKLRRASGASGEARRALLADAEKVLLSIRHEAEGDPGFHLGLGQVYHRLGRHDDGNAELKQILDRKDPELTLAVAHVYRDLGLPVQAKQIAEQLWSSSSEEHWKQQAASLLSLVVNEVSYDEDEEETWLKRSDPSAPHVKLNLQGLQARRLRRQGKLAEADQAFARIAEANEKTANSVTSGANNAAVAYLERYQTTGDPQNLKKAVKHLEAAHRLSPQDAVVTGNLADALEVTGTIAVLERWVRTRTLTLGSGEAQAVLAALLAGPLHDDVVAALRQDPSMRRALDVTQEEQTLAPQKADGYARQIRWLGNIEDDKALVALQRRLSTMPRFDTAAAEEARKTAEEHTRDARDKAMLAETITRARETVERARRAGHDPTTAAALVVLFGQVAGRMRFDPTAADIDLMVDTARQAAQLWPEGGMAEALPGALLLAGLYRAAVDSPPIARAIAADARGYGTAMLLQRMMTGPDGAAVVAALRARPELAEAARLRLARGLKRPGLTDVVLARASGNAELEQAAAPAFKRVDLGASLAIEATLNPGLPAEKAELDFFTSGGR